MIAIIEKGGPNLGRAREGRLNEDNELGNPRYLDRLLKIKDSE